MKNEELFDLITQLKIDDEYIEKALSDELDDSTAKVYAGKARIAPMRIIAPIAACLAVIAAAGLVLTNKDKLTINPDKGEGTTSIASSDVESAENSDVESTDNSATESTDPGYSFIDLTPFPSQNKKFVDKCKNEVTSKFAQVLPNGTDWSWQIEDMDMDYDGYNELLLCPQINGRSIKGVGVCVFKRARNDDAIYLGSFGSEFTTMNLRNLYTIRNTHTKDFLYFNNNEESGKCVDSIQLLFVDKDTNTIYEKTYLRLVKTHYNGEYTETAYRYGSEISTKELLEEWSNNKDDFDRALPIPNVSDAHNAAAEYVQLLVDKYNVPLEDGLLSSLHRTIQKFDINGDGEEETIIEFRNCEKLRGIYVFSPAGRLIGELDLEGERGVLDSTGSGSDTIARMLYTDICKFDKDGESYYYYRSCHSEERESNTGGWAAYGKWAINKIVVNEDGKLSSKAILEYGSEFVSDTGLGSRDICQINGKDVSLDELHKEETKYPYINRPFVW
ncbi:MAG: hypothetical protein K2J80_11705 [Oscillospiraceae bacterium]|nr:hypothetical protein [Oscillospiraceae bacterium]